MTPVCSSPTPCSPTAPPPPSSGPGPTASNWWPPAAATSPKTGKLYNQLSGSLPRRVTGAVSGAVQSVLRSQGLEAADVAHWALHGGGEKIIAALARELDLSVAKLRHTREILARFGNMSSPSVLFTLREILDNRIQAGDWCLMAAFGAGLSAHALLLRS
jgi:predicted naringenin-chalcone synthase